MSGDTRTDAALWSPQTTETTRIVRFRTRLSKKYAIPLPTYEALWRWSIDRIDLFWAEVWDETGVVASKRWDSVVDTSARIDTNPTWFPGARLNWAENMLQDRSPDRTAVIEFTEADVRGADPTYNRMSYAELYDHVRQAAHALRKLGVKPLDRVGYYGPNIVESVIACLATTAVGAIWSSTAADFGPEGVINRFVQIRPNVLISATAVRYNGKVHSHLDKLRAVLDGLDQRDVRIIVVECLEPDPSDTMDETWTSWTSFIHSGQNGDDSIDFYQAPFDHPLWILFSSGTTGQPKAIVHRAGGMLLQSKKEHLIHGDMSASDVFFYFTTPGWMMWNYLLAGLSFGCTLVLFDGSPLYDPALLWRAAEDLEITVFGTSAKYIEVLSKMYTPKEHHKLPALRQILSTGSPLAPELFDWVYRSIKSDVLLGSITGGSDLCSLFAGHNAALPVFRSELQARNLGMAIEVCDDDGNILPPDTPGDLICLRPFPCMPIYFWNDEGGAKYHASYFEKFPGVWHHGDYCMLTTSRAGNGGGLIMLGRSDAVLNPQGVRFGSGEIYSVLESLPATMSSPIEDAVAVGLKTSTADERVVLFLKLREGSRLETAFIAQLKAEIRHRRSARHVPSDIIAVRDIPYTINNKKVEVPVKKLVNGALLSSINSATLRNPECLDDYVRLGDELRSQAA